MFYQLHTRRSQWISWEYSYRQLWTAIWVLEIELRTSVKVAGALNC